MTAPPQDFTALFDWGGPLLYDCTRLVGQPENGGFPHLKALPRRP